MRSLATVDTSALLDLAYNFTFSWVDMPPSFNYRLILPTLEGKS
jgi:hypothetical protein